jgi:hypothetical protein
MMFIAFGRWSNAAGRWFIRERIYWRGYRWMPFVRVRRRYPLAMHLSAILPRCVVYYAVIRAWAEATSGQWSHEDVTGVMASDIVKRWEEVTE